MEDYRSFKMRLPQKKRHLLTKEVYDSILKLNDDPELDLREEMVTYNNVLQEGRYKLLDYAKACKYVAYKSMGFSNFDAYKRVFPDKVKKWLEDGVPYDHQHAYVGKYNKSKLVVEITKKALIPVHILNQDVVQKAINVQVELMMNAKSELVRQKAAESLMKELKMPEDNKLELDIKVKKDESLISLEETLNKLATKQIEMINSKEANPKDIAEMSIITVEAEEDNNE